MSQSPSAVESAAGPSDSSSRKDASVMTEPPSAVETATGPLVSLSQEDASVMSQTPTAVEPAAGPSTSSSQEDAGPHEILDADLIEEIKNHRVLFMYARQEYEEQMIKKKPWFEICKLLFKNWNSYSLRKKLDTVKNLQKRWAELKEEFFLRLDESRPNSPVPKKTKTIYDNMNFLLEPADDEMGPVYSGNDFDPGNINLLNKNPQQTLINLSMHSTSSANVGHKAANTHFTSLVASLLNNLDREQNFATWKVILELVQEVEERNSRFNKYDPIYVPGMGTEPSLSVPAEEATEEPTEEAIEAATEEATEEEASASYQSTQARPRNENGELEYPVTDEEDVEV